MPQNLALGVLCLLALALSAQARAQAPTLTGQAPQGVPSEAATRTMVSADTGTIAIRTGSHPSYGRIVFDAPANATYRLSQEGDWITVRFPDDQPLNAPGKAPRNVSALSATGSVLRFSIVAGASIREMRLGQRLVIDILDPATSARRGEVGERETPAADMRPDAGEDPRPSALPARAMPRADAAGPTRVMPRVVALDSRTPNAAGPGVIALNVVDQNGLAPALSGSAGPVSSASGPQATGPAATPPVRQTQPQATRPTVSAVSQPTPNTAAQSAPNAGAQPTPNTATQPAPNTAARSATNAATQPTPNTATQPTQTTAAPSAPNTAAQPTPNAAAQLTPKAAMQSAVAAATPSTSNIPTRPTVTATAQPAPNTAMQSAARATTPSTSDTTARPAVTTATPPAPAASPAPRPGSPVPTEPPSEPRSGATTAAGTPSPVLPRPYPEAAEPPAQTRPSPSFQPTSAPPPSADPAQGRPMGPIALMVRRLQMPPSDQAAIVIPFSDTVGTAMLRRNDAMLIVFAERRPLDLGPLRDDPLFGQANAHVLPNGTMLHLPLPEGQSATLSATPQGWRVTLNTTEAAGPAIAPEFADGKVVFPVPAPVSVITLRDPDSGATMLIGTVGRGGEAITTERRNPAFILPRTLRGVAVEALSDTLALRVVPTGFSLTGGAEGLPLSPPATMTNAMLAAARLTRRFHFPAMPTEGLARRVKNHVLQAATLPPLARGPARKVAAESLVALGMAAEAEALLRVIVEQDPKQAGTQDTIILRAIAALLNGRTQDARVLAEPNPSGTDEDALWRAVLLATRQEGSPEAAHLFASTAPLLLTYPPALRHRLLPLAIETMILGGSMRQAEAMLAERPNDPRLRLARAFAHQARGETEAALALFDQEAESRDQLVHARAAARAVDLRLGSGKMDAATAADALDRLLYAWRGDWRDLALRRRIAELRQHAGAWRTSLAVLRTAAADFPSQAAQVRSWQQSAFAELVHGDALERMAPMELIGLVEENPDLLPADEGGDRLRDRLADRLLALDLPKRADAVLTRLMQTAPTDLGRTTYGTRLAGLRLREGDAEGVLAALGQSSNADLPPEIKEQRLLLAAGAAARMGNARGAINALNGIDSAAADGLRAGVLEQAGDWAGAKRSLASLVRRTVPAEGDLDDAQRRVVLRLATAAARAGDNGTLTMLRDRESNRMGPGPIGDMFRLLTAEPVRATSDLGRARQEIDLARALPAGLDALQGGAPQGTSRAE